MNKHNHEQESGIILVALLFIVAVMVFGYVVINSISKTREANRVRESTSDVIDAAKDTVETVNNASDSAQDLINN